MARIFNFLFVGVIFGMLISGHYMMKARYQEGYERGRIQSLNDKKLQEVVYGYCNYGVIIEVPEGKFSALCMPVK